MAEWAAAFAADPTGEKRKLVPVRVRPTEIDGFLAQVVYVDLVGLDEATARERLLKGLARGRARPATTPFPGRAVPAFPGAVAPPSEPEAAARLADLPLDTVPEPGPLPPGSRMPLARNKLFVGREDDLRALARHLKAGETAAVGQVEIAATTGLGGIGKTQLACELVHRYGRYFAGGVFWLSFAEAAAVPAEVAACGRRLAGPELDDWPLERQVRWVEDAWQGPLVRLLVFDNCEDPELLERCRPRAAAGCWSPAGGRAGIRRSGFSRCRWGPCHGRRAWSSCAAFGPISERTQCSTRSPPSSATCRWRFISRGASWRVTGTRPRAGPRPTWNNCAKVSSWIIPRSGGGEASGRRLDTSSTCRALSP